MQSEIATETNVGRVALRVTDLDGVSRFYETVVGLDRPWKRDGRAVLGAGGVPLLELIGDEDSPQRKRTETGLFHTAFLVPSRSALADALVRIENGWELEGASNHRVSEALYLSDPDGNGIEVYCDRPRVEWPIGENGDVKMETRSLDIDELRSRSTEAAENGRVPPETVIGHIHLEVSSIAAARAFYVDTMGMRIRQQYGPSALFLAANDYHHHIGVNAWNHRTKPGEGCGLEWFELVVLDRTTLDAIRERFTAHGVSTTPTEHGFEVADSDEITVRFEVTD